MTTDFFRTPYPIPIPIPIPLPPINIIYVRNLYVRIYRTIFESRPINIIYVQNLYVISYRTIFKLRTVFFRLMFPLNSYM